MQTEQTALIVRGVLSLARRLRAEQADDGAVSPAAFTLLAALYRLGPIPAVRLAAEERLQPQSLTRLLAALERQGLISRTPGPNDRRERVIALTRHGRDMLASGLRDRGRWLEAAMADTLTDREQAALLNATSAMIKLANYAAPSSAEEKGPGGKRSSRRDKR